MNAAMSGTLVVSLDFEVHWGVRDRKSTTGAYRDHLLGVRQAVPAMLALFEEFEIAATWATVGFLFARSREELQAYSPKVRPVYENDALNPYRQEVGEDESRDPFHFAPGLIDLIERTPRQEIATHTFSHFYCLDAQDPAAFRADLESARAVAAARGLELRSIVFPRNQYAPWCLPILEEAGITCFRGNPSSGIHRGVPSDHKAYLTRAARALDSYVNLTGHNTTSWRDLRVTGRLCNVPASFFFRPVLQRGRALHRAHLGRLRAAMRHAAEKREILHLWWHPHNWGADPMANLEAFRSLLLFFRECRSSHGMESHTMHGVARRVLAMEG